MLETFFKNTSQKILAQYTSQIKEINQLGDQYKRYTDVELKQKTVELKTRLLKGKTKNKLDPELCK